MSRKISHDTTRKTYISDDFRSILKDTEKNISSIKSKLEDRPSRDVMTSYLSTPLRGNEKKYERLKYSPRQNHSPRSQTSETSLVTSLFQRMEMQAKTIAHLSETVQVQSDEIRKLKDRQNDLENRIRGSSNFNIDRKMESLQRELQSEIDSLRTMLNNNYGKHNSTYNEHYFSRDIQVQKRMIEDETDSIRREVDSLKQRIMKIESDLHISIRDSREYERKFKSVERDVSLVNDSQRQLKRVGDRREEELGYLRRELQEISNTVVDLNRESYRSNQDSKLKFKSRKQTPYSRFDDDDWLKNDDDHVSPYGARKKYSSSYLEDNSLLESSKKKSSTYLDDSQLLTALSYSSDLDLSLESLEGRGKKANSGKLIEDDFATQLARLDMQSKYLEEDGDLMNSEELVKDTKNNTDTFHDSIAERNDNVDDLSLNLTLDDDDSVSKPSRK
ncbi:uncharacterized protein LOC130630540 [Hydractinia symbiolongicarpus]|uniref:uncharacterized protein LOC130630540 n=1 Tax=Hydractinia symbiolongicarpus TaxID=13093 RepID=UPI00254B05BF|nr:uncharacterized protein LOC130630540 [Hydractinia symbiolongicarpus]